MKVGENYKLMMTAMGVITDITDNQLPFSLTVSPEVELPCVEAYMTAVTACMTACMTAWKTAVTACMTAVTACLSPSLT